MPPKADASDVSDPASAAARTSQRNVGRASTLEIVPADVVPGVRVIVLGKFNGVVRFTGETQFATGNWIGVELDTLDGKNDGTVKGVVYFRCEMNRGIFARPNAVKVEAAPKLHVTAVGSSTATPSSPSSTTFQRRESLAPDMQKSSIHVADGDSDMQELLQTCSSEVQRLQGAVDRLTAALDGAAARDANAAPPPAAQQTTGAEPTPDFEAWLQAASSRIEKRLEERLQQTLQEQVQAVVAQPLAELEAAAEELQKMQTQKQKSQSKHSEML